jgi:hypothetical protein
MRPAVPPAAAPAATAGSPSNSQQLPRRASRSRQSWGLDLRNDQPVCGRAGRLEPPRDIGPVGYAPPRLHIVGLDIAVLQVESVLPHVEQLRHRPGGQIALVVAPVLDDQLLA